MRVEVVGRERAERSRRGRVIVRRGRVEDAGQSQKKRVGTVRASMLCHGAIGSLVLGAIDANGAASASR